MIIHGKLYHRHWKMIIKYMVIESMLFIRLLIPFLI
jgi:hypothetical protein